MQHANAQPIRRSLIVALALTGATAFVQQQLDGQILAAMDAMEIEKLLQDMGVASEHVEKLRSGLKRAKSNEASVVQDTDGHRGRRHAHAVELQVYSWCSFHAGVGHPLAHGLGGGPFVYGCSIRDGPSYPNYQINNHHQPA